MKILKTLFLLSCCFLSYLTYKVYEQKPSVTSNGPVLELPNFEEEVEDFQLYEKKTDEVERVSANREEGLKLQRIINSSRGPASVKSRQREFLGQDYPMEDLKFTNSIDAEWKEKLGGELLRFQAVDTKANIHSEKSFIQTDGKKNARFVEQVRITFFLTTGEQNSYHALVDSESGVVIKTWNKMIAEKNINLPVN